MGSPSCDAGSRVRRAGGREVGAQPSGETDSPGRIDPMRPNRRRRRVPRARRVVLGPEFGVTGADSGIVLGVRMLRIYFSAQDLARIRMVSNLGPVVESVFALEIFGTKGGAAFNEWR